MLSKIVDPAEVHKELLQHFGFPSPQQIQQMVEEKKRESERRRIVEENKEDPLAAAKKEAHRILLEAQEKLKVAEAEAALLRAKTESQVREKLNAEFAAKVSAAVEHRVETLQQSFGTTLEELATLKDDLYKNSEAELMNLVFTVVRKIIGDEVQTSPTVVLNMLRKGFDRVRNATRFEIRITPEDYDILLRHKEKIKEIIQTSGNVKFVKDESIERGGCKIITESGEVSAEPGSQMELITKELQHGT